MISSTTTLPHVDPTRLDAPKPTSAKPPRDGFLDTVRAIALSRVIIWHAFGVPWISWVIATMPTMFFIAGSLLASTLDRKSLPVMYRSRLKRLLVPYWFFALSVLTFFSLVHLISPSDDTVLRSDQLLPWLVPFADPTGPVWEGGWASSPLWYLRAYLWLLLLSPVLRAAVRCFGAWALAPSVLGAAAVEWWLHNPETLSANPGTLAWMVGELFLYSFFLMLGFLHCDGAFEKLDVAGLREWAAIGIVACVIWWSAFPAPTGVVNHSFIALMAVGVAWLAAFLLARPVLSRATENSITGPFVYLFTRRALTIYLWHSPCIAASYWIVEAVAPDAAVTTVLLPTSVLLILAIALTGWIEDISAGRHGELWPRLEGSLEWRTPWTSSGPAMPTLFGRQGVGLAVGAAGALIVAGLLVSPVNETSVVTTNDAPQAMAMTTNDADLPPAPSGRPSVADFGDAPAESADVIAQPQSTSSLDQVITDWMVEYDVSGVRVAVSTEDGDLVSAAVGDERGERVSVDDVVALTSATKSMTAAVILDLVDQGLLDLDAQVPPLDVVPEFQHAVTLRQVLDHTAGIAPYQETAGFTPNESLTSVTALRLSAAQELQWTPGTERGYSNSGYLYLGLLAEQLTGQMFAEIAGSYSDRLSLPTLYLDETVHQGWVGASAGGLEGTVVDLAAWGAALYRDEQVLSPEALANMVTLDETFGIGLGAFPVCPCGTDENGARVYTSIGHNGGEVTVQYSPADGLVIAVSLSESLWTPFLSEQDVHVLLEQIRLVMA